MSPGKARLWTGIGCVGTAVLVAVFLLATNAAEGLLPSRECGTLQEYVWFLGFFSAAALFLLPFDFIGGISIPRAFEDQSPVFGMWFKGWFRCVSIQILLYSLLFFLYLQIGREAGAVSLIVIFIVIQLTLIAGQEPIWRAMTAQKTASIGAGSTLYLHHSDRRFAGGITGLPGFESILIPADWKTGLPLSSLEVIIKRRQAALKSGGRFRGVLVAVLWNVLCLTAAIVISGVKLDSVASLVTAFLWFLLFSFLGLLVLPTLNRRSVFALDQSLLNTMNSAELARAICDVDQLSDNDSTRSVSEESIFQPIPCPGRRELALVDGELNHIAAWNVARTALFLSWAFGGPLGRAVHCNVGRPELWAMPPAD